MSELKQCAHCGGKANKFRCDASGHYYTRVHYYTQIYGRPLTHKFIMCEKCGIRTKVYATDKGAFNAWNRRAEMADCSKTEVFLAETDRICEDCGEYLRDNYCDLCPIKALCDAGRYDRNRLLDEAIEFVQKWSDEHPLPKPKTYADDFFEKFPNTLNTAIIDPSTEHKYPVYCRDIFYGLAKHLCPEQNCEKCWNEPYKEEENNV